MGVGYVRGVVGSCPGMGRFYVHMDVATTHITTTTHSSSCFQAEQFIMSSSDKKSSSSPEQKPSSKEQQTSPSGAEYIGVVRHPALSTYYIHKDIINMPVCKTPDFEAAPSRVHSLTTLAYLAWIGWPRSNNPEPDNPNKTCSCGCTTDGRPHKKMRQD